MQTQSKLVHNNNDPFPLRGGSWGSEVTSHGLVCLDCGGQHTPCYWSVCESVSECRPELDNILLLRDSNLRGNEETLPECKNTQIQNSSLLTHTDTSASERVVYWRAICHFFIYLSTEKCVTPSQPTQKRKSRFLQGFFPDRLHCAMFLNEEQSWK